jgi:galactokinase
VRTSLRSYWVPGRIEFLGKHTDYAGGRSLVCAIERGVTLHATARTDSRIHITNAATGAETAFEISPRLSLPARHWIAYFKTVVRRLARDFPTCRRGVDVSFISTLPQDAGLSSSSTLVVACYLAIADANDLPHRADDDLAGYLGAIESGAAYGEFAADKGVGTAGGSEDHVAIIASRPGELGQYSFCPVIHERQVPLPSDLVFVVAVSGVAARKTGAARGPYNRTSRQASELVKRWRRATGQQTSSLAALLRSSDNAPNEMLALVADEPALRNRLEQFLVESQGIVPAAGDALLQGDWEGLGILVDRSQDLAERCLGNQVPETSFLAGSARELGAVAASAFGAGFGGSVWALIPEATVEDFRHRWAAAYRTAFPQHALNAQFFITHAGPGVRRL